MAEFGWRDFCNVFDVLLSHGYQSKCECCDKTAELQSRTNIKYYYFCFACCKKVQRTYQHSYNEIDKQLNLAIKRITTPIIPNPMEETNDLLRRVCELLEAQLKFTGLMAGQKTFDGSLADYQGDAAERK